MNEAIYQAFGFKSREFGLEGEKLLEKINYQPVSNRQSFKGRYTPKSAIVSLSHSIAQADEIKICPHNSLDHDALNSALVMNDYFKSLGKKVSVCYNKSEAKGLFLNFFDKFRIKKAKNDAKGLKFVVDWNDKVRIPQGNEGNFDGALKDDIVGLDHHTRTDFVKKTQIYVNDKAKSCCEMVFGFLSDQNQKISRKNLERLYCGILSDGKKFKIIDIQKEGKSYSIERLPALGQSPKTQEILDKIEASLSKRSKTKVYKHLDVMSNLTSKEKSFQKELFSNINVTPNGKLAYAVIEPDNPKWVELGMDNTRTSAIIGDLRSRIVHQAQKDPMISDDLHQKLKNTEGMIVFYRVSPLNTTYQMSITTQGDYAERIIKNAKTKVPDLAAGGHPNRAGGRILSVEKEDIQKFINLFLDSAQELSESTKPR